MYMTHLHNACLVDGTHQIGIVRIDAGRSHRVGLTDDGLRLNICVTSRPCGAVIPALQPRNNIEPSSYCFSVHPPVADDAIEGDLFGFQHFPVFDLADRLDCRVLR